MRHLVVVLPALTLATAAQASTIAYGARVGMELTIVKKTGIGSTHASILAKHNRRKAGVFCREYGHDFSKDCIDAEMKSPLHFEITANCKTGKFTTFYGANMLFQGHNEGTDVTTDYLITSIDDNVVLDGSGASGYDYTLEQFKALCPNRVK
ncbi:MULTISPECIES: hypothetical protein [unclassified Mesorhizobium]|uniref:hypothetical protein n=1 Tax=unclassified Mesorhizobium TaxID=325217 RepID=UPI000FCCBE5A|nr:MULTISPECIES: hypothetical protein [unclassified Mesorhizobium]RUW75209.1 hypothetical protein EOA31_09525 [Mesorhizobium sp. M4B.F.Ca.ET.049.02.1.2]TGV22994.1 hypothetical protein EN786_26315 [Mesorhizobium sp. M4B.F.Ca.ET.143.01.1.1]